MNTTSTGGGIDSLTDGTVNLMQGAEMISNSAGSSGGAVALQGATLTSSQHSILTQNSATLYGGAIYVISSSKIYLKDGTRLSENIAKRGGAVYLYKESEMQAESECIFSNNTAQEAGGAVSISDSSFSAANCRFVSNMAVAGYGGALSVGGIGSVVKLKESLLSLNSATRGDGCTLEDTGCGGGGAISLAGNAKLTLSEGTQCVSNSASGDSRESSGGCILAWGSTWIRLENSSVLENWANDADGGGIALLQDSALECQGSTFAMNWARSRGGAVFIGPGYAGTGTALTLFYTNFFVRNTAKAGDGGSVFAYRTINGAVGGTTKIEQNSAVRARGGGVAMYNSQLQISSGHQVNFFLNEAGLGGGIALLSGASLSLIKETCTLDCKQSEALGNGICQPECFNRACMWDGGDCMPHLKSAGDDAARPCERNTCKQYTQTSLRATTCSRNCFTGCSCTHAAASTCCTVAASFLFTHCYAAIATTTTTTSRTD